MRAVACFSTWPLSHAMAFSFLIRRGFILLAILHVVFSSGSYKPKKLQIHVPHNIQHHHHTHTKYHFITVPIVRVANETTTTARPAMVMPVVPVMPVMPGVMANVTPAPMPTPAATLPPVAPNPNLIPAMYINNEYDLIDMFNRRRGEKYVRTESNLPPMKFRTIISVQETKKIPLGELLGFKSLLTKEPRRRVKVEVIPDKSNYAKPSVDWAGFHDNTRPEDLEYDSESASYQSRMEQVAEKPEWTAVRQLLEKHIKEDFPGLQIQAEIKQVGPSERADPRVAQVEPMMDLKHVGYILIDDKDQRHFVGFNSPKSDPVT